MRGFRKTFGHLEVYNWQAKSPAKNPRLQHAVRYNPKTFYKLVQLCESEGVSVNTKVNEIVERYLGVRNG